MANELAKHLSHMKISELNSDETENIFKVKIDTELSFLHDSGRLQESLRVWMNPRDMTSMKLIAGLLINIRNQIYACWPSSLTLLNTVRISPSLATQLQVSSDESVKIKYHREENIPTATVVKYYLEFESQLIDKSLVEHSLRKLPVMQASNNYVLENRATVLIYEVEFKDLSYVNDKFIAFKTDESTKFVENKFQPAKVELSLKHYPTSSIGGLDSQKAEIKKIMEAFFNESNYDRPIFSNGLIIHGQSGCGKTTLVHEILSESKFKSFCITPRLMSVHQNLVKSAEKDYLKDIFQRASKTASSIIFIDDLDIICPKKDHSVFKINDLNTTTKIIGLIDGLNQSKSHVFIISTAKSVEKIDLALRRPGRFTFDIEIPVPDRFQRFKIMEKIINSWKIGTSKISRKFIKKLSDDAHGFVGADLECIIKEASVSSVLRSTDENIQITDDDLKESFILIKPSCVRDIQLEVPKIQWDDIGGQDDTKQRLREYVEWPLKMDKKFKLFGIKPPKGLLLYGPPGCSKTLMAKALATESGLNFLAVKGPELLSKWVGESEKAVREIFRKARRASPSIIFFDEFDSIGCKRGISGSSSVTERVLSQLLSELDGIDPLQNVIVVAATNRPDHIDDALLRPGRFDRHVYVKLPDLQARLAIIQIASKKMPFDNSVNFSILAQMMDGYSGAEITAVCRESGIISLNENLQNTSVTMDHLLSAISLIQPRTPPHLLKIYDRFSNDI